MAEDGLSPAPRALRGPRGRSALDDSGRRRSLLGAVPVGLVLALGGARQLHAQTAATTAPAATATPSTGGPGVARPARVVCLGGTMTEIVYALGAGGRLVGVDESSTYPPEARELPKVGYYRAFSIEGVASLRPDLVIASDQAGPASALERLRALGVPLLILAAAPRLDALAARIEGVAQALGEDAHGRALIASIRAEVGRATAAPHPARVLALSQHTGRLMVAGRDTAVDAILALVGATNLGSNQNGYKPIAGEAVAALRPDFILTTRSSLAAGGVAAFAAQPGIAATPAARGGQIIVIDDLLLLGFGPRVGEAVRQVAAALP